MVVQRKWMYLESIFIGGDIRAQLPEEAKKFDDIDKTFKKVCDASACLITRALRGNKVRAHPNTSKEKWAPHFYYIIRELHSCFCSDRHAHVLGTFWLVLFVSHSNSSKIVLCEFSN